MSYYYYYYYYPQALRFALSKLREALEALLGLSFGALLEGAKWAPMGPRCPWVPGPWALGPKC